MMNTKASDGKLDETKMTPKNILHLVVICMGVALYALNSLITSTLLPSAVDDLSGVEFLNWSALLYTTAAMITSLATGTVKSKIGGRAILTIAGVVFAVGSLLVSLAPSIELFLLSRIIQGAGGGLILASCYTVISDLFPRSLWPTVFAMESVVWGAASIGGPLAGGIFAETIGWRGGFYVVTGFSVLFVILVRTTFPNSQAASRDSDITAKKSLPFLRLGLLTSSVLIVAMANRLPDYAIVLLILGFVLFGLFLYRDKKAVTTLLPRHGLSLLHTSGTGLAIVFLSMASAMSFVVYGPYILQKIHGFSPLSAGLMVAVESLSWSIAAMLCAKLPQNTHWRLSLIPIGVFVALLGVYGIAISLYVGPLWLLSLAIILEGAGFGIFWADLSSVIIETGSKEEQDRRSGAIPTLQMCGAAFGPAVAGIPAAIIGFKENASLEIIEQTAYWVHAIFVPVLVIATILAIRMVRLKRREIETTLLASAPELI